MDRAGTTTKKNDYAVRVNFKCELLRHKTVTSFISANCYSKIKEETSALQDKMIKEQGLNPIDKEIAILYQGERQQYKDDFLKVFTK